MAKKRVIIPQKKIKKTKKASTPFADAGAIVGQRVGQLIGYPMLKGVGRWLGGGIGSILGSGDYQMLGSTPKYNVLTSDVQVPQFSVTRQTNIVCHREYLGDISGTTAFTTSRYVLNPGNPSTFPWLSVVAQNYQEYRFHGLIFEFKSLLTENVTAGTPGSIIISTNYNAANAPNYTTKQQMENTEYAVSTKPTASMIHGVECALDQTSIPIKFIRAGAGATQVGQDSRLYDLGLTQIATSGNPTVAIGELWVSYCVELFKPTEPVTLGGDIMTGFAHRTTFNATNPLGTVNVAANGTLGIVTSPTLISWVAAPGEYFLLTVTWSGTTAAAVQVPSPTLSGLSYNPMFGNGYGNWTCPSGGASSLFMNYSLSLATTITTPGVVSLTLGTGGTFPSGTTDVVILVTQLDNSVSFV